jgi:outer membrane protein OmpA-like peptidoglycan-associated protein
MKNIRSNNMLNKKSIIAGSIATIMLAGCFQSPGLIEDTSYDRTKTGAVLGAITGALIGHNRGHHHKTNAVVGGLLGAAAGGAIGYSLDKQANEVANALGTGVNNDPLAALDPNKTIIVSKHPGYVKIMFRDRMMFATNSAILQPQAKVKVQKVAQLLQRYPQTIVAVAGFTDNTGSYDYNLKLSQKRAKSVANLLAVNNRYPATKGCSELAPIAPNDTAAHKALNRRVEVYLFANQNTMIDPCQ